MKRTWPYGTFVLVILAGWGGWLLLGRQGIGQVYSDGWPVAVTMIVGAFIAGATSEGGGAIAFPVMTLLLAVTPADARIFSLGIQSFGMTAATLLILGRRIPIARGCLRPVIPGGILGFIASDLWLVDVVSAPLTKLLFVSLWLGFGFALFLIRTNRGVVVRTRLPGRRTGADFARMFLFGIGGGAVSAMFGNGIDILTFTLLTLYYRIDVKVATPTSVVLMTAMTVFGFLWHLLVRRDVSAGVETYLLAALPIVLFMAPLGAYVVSRIQSSAISVFLYLVIIAQFITGWLVVRPSGWQAGVSLTAAVVSASMFYLLGRCGTRCSR